MKKITWKVQYAASPAAIRYCKKCHTKTGFISSDQFRINAQQKYLDVWLIYKCPNCGTTWNAAVYSRISPQTIAPELLDRFHRNDKALAESYAMDVSFLRRNKAEYKLPCYSIDGESVPLGETFELKIISNYSLPLKVSSLLRRKLNLSQRDYLNLISEDRIQSIPNQDLRKCRLNNGIVLRFS